MFTQTIPLLFAGGACCVAVLVDLVVVFPGVGVAAGAAAGVVAAGALEALLAAGAGAAELAGAELSLAAVVDFFDFDDFLGDAVLSAPPAVAVSAVSVFFDFVDFLLDAVPLSAVAVSALSDFFDLDLVDFLVVELSPVAVALSAVSLFFDLVDFLEEVVSLAVDESAVSAFFDFDDFLLFEALSVVLLSSVVVLFFFFFDLVVVSLWSDDCVSCAFAIRTETLEPHSSSAAARAQLTDLREMNIVLTSFRPDELTPPSDTRHITVLSGGEQEARRRLAGLSQWFRESSKTNPGLSSM